MPDAIEQNLGLKSLVDKKSAARFFYSYLGLRYRPDWDGYLTLTEANEWYRYGQGRPLFVDINKIDLGVFFNERPKGSSFLRSLIIHSGSVNDALVYGTITLTSEPNNMVSSKPDTYNFDIKPITSLPVLWRNVSTIIGAIAAGPGSPYRINVYGTKQMRNAL